MDLQSILLFIMPLVYFIICLYAFSKGVQLGKTFKEGKDIGEIIKPPKIGLKSLIKNKQNQKEIDEMMQGFNNVMSYSGEPQKKEGE